MKTFEFKNLSKYRSELFGFSILSILVVHYAKDIQTSHAAISHAAAIFAKYYRGVIASEGVDIFIFLSGMGLFFAMQKQQPLYEFYKRRLSRILVPYMIVMPAFLFYMNFIVEKTSLSKYILRVSLGSFWLKNGSSYVWFLALILPLYIVFPFVYEMINSKNGFRNTVFLVGLCYLFLFSCKFSDCEQYFEVERALVRVPIFILGVYYGGKAYRKEKASIIETILLVLGAIIMFMYFANMLLADLHLYHKTRVMNFVKEYFEIFFRGWAGIGLMIIMVYFFQLMPKIISRFFTFFSGITLELYITHEIMRKLFKIAGLPIHKFVCYLFAMLLSLAFAFLLHWISEKIICRMLTNTNINIKAVA